MTMTWNDDMAFQQLLTLIGGATSVGVRTYYVVWSPRYSWFPIQSRTWDIILPVSRFGLLVMKAKVVLV